MYKLFVENGISKWSGDYSKCYVCLDLVIPDGKDEALKHIIDPNHRELIEPLLWCRHRETVKLKEIKSLTEDDYCELVQNNICFRNNSYFCNLCCDSFFGYKFIQEHLKTEKHQRHLKVDFKTIIYSDLFFKYNNYFCKPCSGKFSHIQSAYDHAISKQHKQKLKKKIAPVVHQKEIQEADKPLDIPKDTLKGNQDLKRYNLNDKLATMVLDLPKDSLKGDQDLERLNSNDILVNMEEVKHLTNFTINSENQIKNTNKRSNKHCKVCNCIVSVNGLYDHINTTLHLKNLHEMNIKFNVYTVNNTLKLYFYCCLCKFWIEKNETLLQCHIMLHLHEYLPDLQYDIIKFDFKNKNVDIQCLLCNFTMNSDIDLAHHIHSINHLQKLQNNFLSKKNENVEPLTNEKLTDLLMAVKKNPKLSQDNFLVHFQCYCTVPMSRNNGHIYNFRHKPVSNLHNKDHIENNSLEKLNENFSCYKCFMCDKSLPSINNLLYHYFHNSKHKHRYKNCYNKLYNSNKYRELACGESKIDKKSSSYEKNKISGSTCRFNEYFCCKICNFYIPAKEIFLIQGHCMYHLYKDHMDLKDDVIRINSNGRRLKIKCLLCNDLMYTFNCLSYHFYRKKHLTRMKQFPMYKNDMKEWEIHPEVEPSTILQGFHPRTHFSFDYICAMCYIPEVNVDVCTYTFEYDAIPGHKHRLEKSKVSLDISSNLKINFYRCYLCNATCTNKETLFAHYKMDPTHKKNVAYLNSITKSEQNSENTLKDEATNAEACLTDKVHQSLTLDDDNDNNEFSNDDEEEEENDDDDKEIEKIMSRNKYKVEKKAPEREENVLHPHNIVIEQYGSKYIKMCIEPGEQNIFTFDPKDIDQMKLSLSLIFSYNNIKCICLACDYEMFFDPQELFEHLQHENHIENLHDLRNCEPDDEGMSYFDLAKTGLIEKSDDVVRCIVCQQNIDNSYENIKAHLLNQSSHKKKLKQCEMWMETMSYTFFTILDDFWYYAYYFYCVVCKLEIQGELNFARHLEQPVHKAIVQLTNKSYKINKCFSCCSCWYGSPSYSEHCNEYFHKSSRVRSALKPPKLNRKFLWKLQDLRNLTSVSTALIKESDEVIHAEVEREIQLLQDIEQTVLPLYPKARAYGFGSRSCCLGLIGSDMDVFLDLENVYYQRGSKSSSQKYIRRINTEFFVNNKKKWKKEKILLSPRVPIIKLMHRPTGLKCDLSFMNGLGVEKSHLIRKYVMAYKGCRKLILYLKKWFNAIQMYGPLGFNAYAITWLAIFYLQILGIFPSVHHLKPKSTSKVVDGWECDFSKEITIGDNAFNYNFVDLLKGFFSYYAEFDYKTCVVSPLTGKIIKKFEFLTIEKMPRELTIYKNRLKVEELEYFRYDSVICILDPVDLSQNITKGVNKRQLKAFRWYCKNSL